jgi:hypothetical protein
MSEAPSENQCTEAEWLRILAFLLRTTDTEVIAVREVKS